MKKIITIVLAAMTLMSVTASAGPKKKGELKEVTFNVYLHCDNCVEKVTENISFEKGVKDLKVSLDNQTVYVKYDSAKTSEDTLKKALEVLGYPVTEEAEHNHDHDHDHDHNHDHGEHHHHN